MKKIICVALSICCIIHAHAIESTIVKNIDSSVSCGNVQNNTQWWTAISLSIRMGERTSDFEDCHIRILQEDRVITIFTEETFKLISVADETLREDEDGIIYQVRKCVDEDGKICLATFMYYPAKYIFLIVEFNDVAICYVVQPD